MLASFFMATLSATVVRTTVGGYPVSIDYIKSAEMFGPVTITLYDKDGKQLDAYEPYGGCYAFGENDVYEGGRIGNPEYLIVRSNDAPGYYSFVWVGSDQKLMHNDWSSRWDFGGVQGRGTRAILESVDLDRARALGFGFDLTDTEQKEFETKKTMLITHFLVDGKHVKQIAFQ